MNFTELSYNLTVLRINNVIDFPLLLPLFLRELADRILASNITYFYDSADRIDPNLHSENQNYFLPQTKLL